MYSKAPTCNVHGMPQGVFFFEWEGRGGDGKKRPTNYNLSPVQIVIIKGHHMTQNTDVFPRRNCADFSGQGRALKGREIAWPFVLNN